ncbi:MAG: zinc ribbon domain-containing protein [Bdellovibrionales bacterium]|nr:zinc ribbon domain-containing protein [Bdellovibrionales bacterium]
MAKREINKQNKELDQETLKPEERYQLVDASWKPIIDQDVFERTQDRINSNKQVKSAPKHHFVFSGLLTCDECGSPLFGQSGSGRNGMHYYYGHKGKSSCRIKRYPAIELEKIIKKQLFAFLSNQALKEHFVEAISELNNSRPVVNDSLLKMKRAEIEKTQSEIDQLTNILATNASASRLESLIKKLEDSELRLKALNEDLSVLEERSVVEHESEIDLDYLLDGIRSWRSERFRKASLAKKREVLRNIVKTIHIHPENVIRVDFWGTRRHSEAQRESDRGQSGVVLPFRKLGRPLEASFYTGASGGEGMAEIKKAVGLGTFVNCNFSGGRTLDAGSSSIRFGGA